jgi:hypothetical protein
MFSKKKGGGKEKKAQIGTNSHMHIVDRYLPWEFAIGAENLIL